MSLCINGGQCHCQPSEGSFCPYLIKPRGYVLTLHGAITELRSDLAERDVWLQLFQDVLRDLLYLETLTDLPDGMTATEYGDRIESCWQRARAALTESADKTSAAK